MSTTQKLSPHCTLSTSAGLASNMDILVLGHRGYLGNAIRQSLKADSAVHVFYRKITVRDIELKMQRVMSDLSCEKIDYIINCIGNASVSEAASQDKPIALSCGDRTLADETQMPKALMHIMNNYPQSRIIHISSEYVFRGGPRTYTTDSIPNPSTEYGRIKHKVEEELTRLIPKERLTILRLPMIISVKSILRQRYRLTSWVSIVPCDLQLRSAISVHQLCSVVRKIVSDFNPGIVHVTTAKLYLKPLVYCKILRRSSRRAIIPLVVVPVLPRFGRPWRLRLAASDSVSLKTDRYSRHTYPRFLDSK
jgi:dTDP-4-dehydrorhamnose reductase